MSYIHHQPRLGANLQSSKTFLDASFVLKKPLISVRIEPALRLTIHPCEKTQLSSNFISAPTESDDSDSVNVGGSVLELSVDTRGRR